MKRVAGFIYKCILFLALLFSFSLGLSNTSYSNDVYQIPYYSCFINASYHYGVNPEILISIALVESKMNPRAYNVNKNKTYDIGIMQINSSWLPYLRKFGVRMEHLWDPCYNIHIGAMVLRHCMNIYGNTWKAIDCYNKGTKARKSSQYVLRVYKTFRSISEKVTQVTSSGFTLEGLM